MAKLGDCGTNEPTISSEEDDDSGENDFSTSSIIDETDESSMSSSCAGGDCEGCFPIMKLPAEIRAKIFNMLHQRQVPCLRLVCKQWLEEIDEFYEFSFNIYDTTSDLTRIKNLRCRECIIWKLTQNLRSECLFKHPSYLKVIKVFGPTTAENLKNLIGASTNLEHLTMTRRANYPWVLNLRDTPALNNLTELRYLRLMSEEHVQLPASDQKSTLKVPPMMDCYFPKLKVFEILKRFPVWHYSHYVTAVLKFVSRHAESLTHIELEFIPLSCIAWHSDNSENDEGTSSEDEEDFFRKSHKNEIFVSPQEINLPQLCKIRLQKICITTMGCSKDIQIWKSLLESQVYSKSEANDDMYSSPRNSGLRELRFDWLCRDPMTETRSRESGFPWIYYQIPIQANTSTLVHVELANLSMVTKTYPTSPVTSEGENDEGAGGRKIVPFDLSIFRNCKRLKSLILRCRENHGRIYGNESEILLMINAMELPDCIEQLELFRFPMFSSDIESCVTKLVNLKKLFFHECGKTDNFGVGAGIVRLIARLRQLKFLEIVGFNSSTEERKRDLEFVFQLIGKPFEGQDTWLELSDGSTTAYDTLQVVRSEVSS